MWCSLPKRGVWSAQNILEKTGFAAIMAWSSNKMWPEACRQKLCLCLPGQTSQHTFIKELSTRPQMCIDQLGTNGNHFPVWIQAISYSLGLILCHDNHHCMSWQTKLHHLNRKKICLHFDKVPPSGCDFKHIKSCICVKKLNKLWENPVFRTFTSFITVLHFIISPFWNSWTIPENCLFVLTGQPSSILFPLLPNWPRLVLEAVCPTAFKVQSHAELSTLSAVTPLMQTDMSHAKGWLAPNIM